MSASFDLNKFVIDKELICILERYLMVHSYKAFIALIDGKAKFINGVSKMILKNQFLSFLYVTPVSIEMMLLNSGTIYFVSLIVIFDIAFLSCV